MRDRFTKRERATLRDLAAEAHEQELEDALTELYDEFCTWGGKGMSAFELNDKLHEFHDGISRDLYKTYVLNDPGVAAAIGASRKMVDIETIDKNLCEKLAPMIETFERISDEDDAT